jgi:fucose 4-O-acetylase-like acetyltransferase
MIRKRNGFIDFFKGLLILWIIHVHTVFWSGQAYIPEVARQTSLLIDVPAFFFVSGYLTKVTDFISALKRSAKQFVTLYSSYLIFSCLLLIPLSFLFILKDKAVPNLGVAIVSMLKVDPLGELWGDVPVYWGSLWYMCVYFSVIWLAPITIHFFGSLILRIAILGSLLFAFTGSRYMSWGHYFLFSHSDFVYFYLFIFMAGVAYRIDEQKLSIRYTKLSFLFNLALALITFYYLDNGSLNIQAQKFPPSFEYLIYSSLLIHIFVITKHAWSYPEETSSNPVLKGLEWCGKNVYFIYLVQAVVCSAPGHFISALRNYLPIPGIYVVVLLFNLVFTMLLTFLYLKIKSISQNFILARMSRNSV